MSLGEGTMSGISCSELPLVCCNNALLLRNDLLQPALHALVGCLDVLVAKISHNIACVPALDVRVKKLDPPILGGEGCLVRERLGIGSLLECGLDLIGIDARQPGNEAIRGLTVVGSFRMLASQIYRFVPPS